MNKIKNYILKIWDIHLMNLWWKYPIGIVKSPKQIEKIAKACAITDEIFEKIISNFNFQTEEDLRDFILSEIKNRKLRPSFPPIVTSEGRAGNEIHPPVTKGKLLGFTIIDFGVRFKGYCSDMTRTVFVGEPTEEDKNLYQKILDAELLGIENSRAGKDCAHIDGEVRDSLGDLKKYFIHTLGHGVGRMIHEPPRMYFKYENYFLKENMVITIEPGIYIENRLGIRIEDTILVTKNGPEILTKSPKNLLTFRATIG